MVRFLLVWALLNVAILPQSWGRAQEGRGLPYFDEVAVAATAGDAVSAGEYSAGDMGGDTCDTCCDTCCDGCRAGLCGGWILPSDHCFSDFISPMTNPVFFEDPRTLTEARLIYLRHKVPLTALGGEINLVALQLRAALTDRLSLIATKDGYATSTNPLIDDGWADVALGLKYNLYADYELQRLLSLGATYELPVGSTRTLQGNGDGLFHLFLTGGTAIGERNHWISGSGFLLPADRSAESSLWYWSNHFDRRLGDTNFYFLTEFNWYHYMGAGEAFDLAPIEGGDLFNFGTVGVAGNDIVTGAIGVKFKPSHHLELGVAWEVPLTERRDVLDNRLTVDCIFRY
jgi:hypothetical protein